MANKNYSINHLTGSELYVVCSDKNILDDVNRMLLRNGIVCINDMGGRHHYIIDGRFDKKRATNLIHDIVYSSIEDIMGTSRDAIDVYDWCAQSILSEYHFDFSHIGTSIIYWTIKNVILNGREFPINLKRLCNDAAAEYEMTIEQMTRDLRYSVSKSSLSGLKTIYVVRMVYEKIKMKYTEKLSSIAFEEGKQQKRDCSIEQSLE